MSDINRILEEFGLPEMAAQIYINLLSGQPRSVLELSNQLGIPRTSVYDNVQKLLEKGLVERVVTYKSQMISAKPIDYLQAVIDQQKSNLERMANDLSRIKETMANKSIFVPETQVRYYKGVEGFRQMMWNALKAEKETFGYSEFGRVEVVGRDFTDRWVDEFLDKGLKDRAIANTEENVMNYIRETVLPKKHQLRMSDIRLFPKAEMYITGDTTIYNNIFAICYWRQGEITGVEVENHELVKAQKTIFEKLWKMAKPLESFMKS